jgi:spermidine/putrescine transport system permease protein
MNFIKRIIKDELPFFFACPAIIWQLFFVYLPLAVLLFFSFFYREQVTQLLTFSFIHYLRILNSLYFKIIFNSLVLAFITAVICLIIAYPVAYFLSVKVKKFKTFLLFSLILPSWTSFIVQIYAWVFLLKKDGIFSNFLINLGIISPQSHLLNNYFAILVGMTYCFLPFMILPIYAVLERMDKRFIEASADLGGNKWQTFKNVIWPLSFPGVSAGFMLVLIPSFGEFAVPDLLGGGKTVFWGSMIVEKFLMSRDWASGAALTFIGILCLTLFVLFSCVVIKFVKKILVKRV